MSNAYFTGRDRPLHKTCNDGRTCTLDMGHKGPCVQQRMPKTADYDADYDGGFGLEADLARQSKRGGNKWER